MINWFCSCKYNSRRYFKKNGAVTTEYSYAKRMKLNPHLLHAKIYSKWIKDLNGRAKTRLKKNIRVTRKHRCQSQLLYYETVNTRNKRQKQSGHENVKLWASKKKIQEPKQCERTFTNPVARDGVIFRIYKNFYNSIRKTVIIQLKMDRKSEKTFLLKRPPLVLREMPIQTTWNHFTLTGMAIKKQKRTDKNLDKLESSYTTQEYKNSIAALENRMGVHQNVIILPRVLFLVIYQRKLKTVHTKLDYS